MMQVAIFTAAPGDARALEELNRFLRGHRVLTLDRQCQEGVWSFCVTYQPSVGGEAGPVPVGKIDYKQVLDEKVFALFSRLREVRKGLAEKDNLPPYAVFTNEQLAEISRQRCANPAALEKVPGVGAGRVEKYGAAICAAIDEHEKQQGQAGVDRGTGHSA